MSEGPIRATVRGGRDQFQWSSIKEDKHYHNYLGHSLRASRGRWQQGKDLEWFSKPTGDGSSGGGAVPSAEEARREELRLVREAEEDATLVALGLPPKDRSSNTVPLGRTRDEVEGSVDVEKHGEREGVAQRRRRERSRSVTRSKWRNRDSSGSPYERDSSSRREDRYRRRRPYSASRSPSRSRERVGGYRSRATGHDPHSRPRNESGWETRRKERGSRRSRSRSRSRGGDSRSRYRSRRDRSPSYER